MKYGFSRRICKAIILAVLALVLTSTPFVSSLAGISPSYIKVNFFPNAEYTYTFSQEGYSEMDFEYGCPYISANNDSLTDEDGIRSFSVTLKLPEKIDAEPGEYDCGFLLTRPKNPDAPPGISAQAMVGARIIINIPVKGRYAAISLSANNANQGEPVFFNVGVRNLGEVDLTGISAVIDVMDIEGRVLETLRTNPGNVPRFSSAELWKRMETTDYEPAQYKAKAVLNYGGDKAAEAETEFLIGKLFVNFLGIKTNATAEKINPVTVDVESWWGNPIENVRAEVRVYNQSNVFGGDFRTESVDLAPWQKATLQGYWDASDLGPGNYTANITLLYKGGSTEASALLVLHEAGAFGEESIFIKAKDVLTSPIFLAMLVLILIINVSIWLLKQRKAKPKKAETLRAKRSGVENDSKQKAKKAGGL